MGETTRIFCRRNDETIDLYESEIRPVSFAETSPDPRTRKGKSFLTNRIPVDTIANLSSRLIFTEKVGSESFADTASGNLRKVYERLSRALSGVLKSSICGCKAGIRETLRAFKFAEPQLEIHHHPSGLISFSKTDAGQRARQLRIDIRKHAYKEKRSKSKTSPRKKKAGRNEKGKTAIRKKLRRKNSIENNAMKTKLIEKTIRKSASQWKKIVGQDIIVDKGKQRYGKLFKANSTIFFSAIADHNPLVSVGKLAWLSNEVEVTEARCSIPAPVQSKRTIRKVNAFRKELEARRLRMRKRKIEFVKKEARRIAVG